ncbi:MAG: branched chain amino acid aminotransferase, partial [Gemmatimonadota bacterium]|nr:branched chain amino acid aminotransferase [Gemmatimonadota bacterium]
MMQSTGTLPITRVRESRRSTVDFDDLPFGRIWSDHMFVATDVDGTWGGREIRPYGPLPLHPSSKALQYGLSIFEGFKAHETPEGGVALFRPEENFERINRSAARLVMPAVPRELFFEAIAALLEVDRSWLPSAGQGSLYIRPTFYCV